MLRRQPARPSGVARALALAFTILLILPAVASAGSPLCTPEQGQAFIDQGDLNRAVHEFSCVIDANPTEVDGYVGRAEAMLLLGRFSAAFDDYNTGITALVLPVHPDAFATIYSAYATRLASAPNSIPALTGAGFVRWVNFDYAQAVQYVNRLLDVQPDNVFGVLFRGSSRLLQGKTTAKGVADLDNAIALAPTNPSVRHIVADAYTYGLFDPERAAAEATLALGWGLDPERVSVLPNPAPEVPQLPPREELRAELGLDGRLLAFAGRLGPQKSLDVALEAVAAVPGVTLAIAGDGPDRADLERHAQELGLGERARFLGGLPRDRVLRLFRAADAALLSSSWENFPHTVVEALAVGTPVVSTAVGGVPEVVADGENGLLVPPGDPAALAAALARLLDDDALRERLGRAAAPSVAGLGEEATFARIEEELLRAAAA